MGIETLLDTMSIDLQNEKRKNQNGSNKQKASITPPLIKDKKLYVPSVWAQRIQKFKN